MPKTNEIAEPARYGNLRKPKLPGFYGATAGEAFAAAVLVIPGVLVLSFNFLFGLAWLLLAALVLAPWVVGRKVGFNPYEIGWRRYVWARAAKRAQTQLAQGAIGATPDGKTRLPGLLASTELVACRDAYGTEFGLIVSPTPRHYTVVIECFPPGTTGVDQTALDRSAAYWGAWLAELSREPGLVAIQVVIETAPDTGHRLREAALKGVKSDAPPLSTAILDDLIESAPNAAAQVTTRVALTFRGKRGDKNGTSAMVEDIGSRLPGIASSLKMTGAGTAQRICSAQDITDFTRVAFDPDVAALVDEARSHDGTGLHWTDAGPTSAEAGYHAYRHEGAYSVSHQMTEAPRGIFFTLSLSRLLAPTAKVARKRVALLYRPTSPERSAALAESRVRQATFDASQSRTGGGRSQADVDAARQNAQSEAAGSPFVRVGIVTTMTVMDEEDLPLAKRTIESLGTQARLKLRPVVGSQDTAFVASLPLGTVLSEHVGLRVPSKMGV